jgi:hypothetical protein
MTKIKFVHLDELYNFYIHYVCIWNHLSHQKLKLVASWWNFKKQNYLSWVLIGRMVMPNWASQLIFPRHQSLRDVDILIGRLRIDALPIKTNSNSKIWIFQTTSNGETFYIKVIALISNGTLFFYNFLIWIICHRKTKFESQSLCWDVWNNVGDPFIL